MTDTPPNILVYRSLFFTTGEDLYFLTYNLLVVLHSMKASKENPIKDARNLPLLVTLVADAQLVELMARRTSAIPKSSNDYRLLVNAESNARRKRPYLARLLGTLEKRDLLTVEVNNKRRTVGLRNRAAINEFIASPIFAQERANAQRLRQVVPRAKRMTSETLFQRVFQSRGVPVWHD